MNEGGWCANGGGDKDCANCVSTSRTLDCDRSKSEWRLRSRASIGVTKIKRWTGSRRLQSLTPSIHTNHETRQCGHRCDSELWKSAAGSDYPNWLQGSQDEITVFFWLCRCAVFEGKRHKG